MPEITFGPRELENDGTFWHNIMWGKTSIGQVFPPQPDIGPSEHCAYIYIPKVNLVEDVEEAVKKRFKASEVETEFE